MDCLAFDLVQYSNAKAFDIYACTFFISTGHGITDFQLALSLSQLARGVIPTRDRSKAIADSEARNDCFPVNRWDEL